MTLMASAEVAGPASGCTLVTAAMLLIPSLVGWPHDQTRVSANSSYVNPA